MTEVVDPSTASPSLLGVRLSALAGVVAACVVVFFAFGAGLVFGLLALFVFPVFPLAFVMLFEAVRPDGADSGEA